MGDEDTKARRSQRRKRNYLAKELRTKREYLPKIHEPKNIKLPKLNPRMVGIEEDDTL